MKFTHRTQTTAVRQSWLGESVAALAQRTITHLGLPWPMAQRGTRGTASPPAMGRRNEPPPFADTEADWRHL